MDYQSILSDCYERFKNIEAGELASYIPELAKANREHFALALIDQRGNMYSIGDTDVRFSIQSVSKPFTYAYALKEFGEAKVLGKVGVEPTGEAFNSIIELEKKTHRPFNPMINSGAIAISDLIFEHHSDGAFQTLLSFFSEMAQSSLKINEAIYHSEKETAHRNRAIAHLMLHFNSVSPSIEKSLDLYFRQCSIELNVTELCRMAACFSSAHPHSPQSSFFSDEIKQKVLSIMFTCGMYDTSGNWAYQSGLPAKSGVSGAMMAISPGKMVIAAFSPLIDQHGHSVRAEAAIKYLSQKCHLSIFNP